MSQPRLHPLELPVARKRLLTVAVLGALALPSMAQAHSTSSVIAVDYEARLARSEIAAGVAARVIDGNRKLELAVDAPHTVVVMGYGGEPFLRFDAAGVSVNEHSLTAVTNKLTRRGVAPALDKSAQPHWRTIGAGRRFAWHDHRLALVSGSTSRTGRVGDWSIPLRVDGNPLRIEGGLWHARSPPLWPWLLLLGASVGVGAALAASGRSRLRRGVAYVCAAVAATSLLVAVSGFTIAKSSPGEWVSLSLPFVVAAIVVAVFVLRPHLRYTVVGIVGLLVVTEAAGQLSVFAHGYVISALPAIAARATVAIALLGGLVCSIVVLAGLLTDRPKQPARRPVKPAPRFAVPKGKRR